MGNSQWLTWAGVQPGTPVDPDIPDTSSAFSPMTPLITMNAGPVFTGIETRLDQQFNNLPIFGNYNDKRPRSFPTVGFMLFVPRYSHVQQLSASATNTWIPMSEVLANQLDRRNYPATGLNDELTSYDYPADFGHMPVFDNTQQVVNNTYLAEVTKKQCWHCAGYTVGAVGLRLLYDDRSNSGYKSRSGTGY